MSYYLGPDGADRLGDVIAGELPGDWDELAFAVAYAKLSGVDHIYEALATAADDGRGRPIRITVGIDQHGTSYEALAALLEALPGPGQKVYVRHNPRSAHGAPSPTFHPKLWLFDYGGSATRIVGSGNLTGGGLFTNCEVGVVQRLQRPHDDGEIDQTLRFLERCSDPGHGDVAELDVGVLDELYKSNLVMSEQAIRNSSRTAARHRMAAGGREGGIGAPGHFPGEDSTAAPPPSARAPRRQPPAGAPAARPAAVPAAPTAATHDEFYIHLTIAAKRELYLAKAPLREDPAFFGLPFTGRTTGDPAQPQADPWPVVDVTVYDTAGATAAAAAGLQVKFWQYSEGDNANDDVRIYLGRDLQQHIVDGSVLVMRRDPDADLDYEIEIFAPGTADFTRYDALCTNALPNSQRRYGWA